MASRKKLRQKLSPKLINFANPISTSNRAQLGKVGGQISLYFPKYFPGKGGEIPRELSHYIIRKQFAYKYCIRGMAEVPASSQIWARKSDEESDTINNLSIDDPLALNNLSGKNHLSPAISSREISNISTAALTTFQRDLYPMSGA